MQWQFSAGKRLLGMEKPEEFAIRLLELGVFQSMHALCLGV